MLFGKWADFDSANGQHAYRRILTQQRRGKNRTDPLIPPRARRKASFGFGSEVMNVNRLAIEYRVTGYMAARYGNIAHVRCIARLSVQTDNLAIDVSNVSIMCIA